MSNRITAETLVNREVRACVSSLEVRACVSSLVYQLAQGCDFTDRVNAAGQELQSLCEQAYELARPVDDYEEAATQAGWSRRADGMFTNPNRTITGDDGETCLDPYGYADWQALCDDQEILPYEWKVYEHWIVSDWLADKLLEEGEKVDKDFTGLCVWARTTTGQAIAIDAVMERIAAKLNAGAEG